MGFGKMMGGLAKDFAKGYIQERGFQGTLQDIGSIASKMFSNNSEDNDLTNEFWSEYNNLIENDKYSEAETFVRRFYNHNGLDKGVIFYYTIAQSLYFQAVNLYADDSLKMAMKAKENIDTAVGMCEVGTDDYDESRKLRKTIEEAISNARQEICQFDAWDQTINAFTNLADNGNYDKAESILMSYYQDFEDGNLDWFYWRYMAELHYRKHRVAKNQHDAEKEYNIFLQNIDKAIALTNDAEAVKQLSEMRNWDKNLPETADKKSITESSKSSISDSEKEYIEEFKACLSEGSDITDRERRLLDRLRRTLGISEERVAELEAMCNPKQLTQAEQEYADEFKACLSEGSDITDRERRLLDRLRRSLGISEERVAELEAMCNPKQFTQAEQEYADEFKACLSEGSDITDRERRLLDRLRNTLGITESRAAEIEKNIKS